MTRYRTQDGEFAGDPGTAEAARTMREGTVTAGRMIRESLRGSMGLIWRMEDQLKQRWSVETARMAAIIMIQALAQTNADAEPKQKRVLRQWQDRLNPAKSQEFMPALPLAHRILDIIPSRAAGNILREMAETATGIREAIQGADLIGPTLQRLVPETRRRAAATYYTRDESAELLAHLTIPRGLDWSRPETLTNYRMADYSCGSGALLMAAYRRVRNLCRESGLEPRPFHDTMMEQNITAIDIMPANVAAAAANLGGIERGIPYRSTRAVRMHYGPINNERLETQPETRPVGLGSLNLLIPDLMASNPPIPLAMGTAGTERIKLPPESQDAILMNPPFSRRANLQDMDQNFPNEERNIPQTSDQEKRLMSSSMLDIQRRAGAGSNSGPGLYFTAITDRMIRRGGMIGLVLPMSALIGSGSGPARGKKDIPGWQQFRKKLLDRYTGIRIITISQFEEQDSTFSHDTHMPEAMVVARRTLTGERAGNTGHFVNLNRPPLDRQDAALMALEIDRTIGEMERNGESHQIHELTISGQHAGIIVQTPLSRNDIWPVARVLDRRLVNAVITLKRGRLELGRSAGNSHIPLTTIGEIGKVGPDSSILKEIMEEAERMDGEFRVLSGHECGSQRSIITPHRRTLNARASREKKALRTWQDSSSKFHISDSCRYNAQSTAACMTEEVSLAGRGWMSVRMRLEEYEKVLALWMNTSMGLMTHWALSSHQQNGLGTTTKQKITEMPVLDPRKLSRSQLDCANSMYDEIGNVEFLPANEAWHDQNRIELDQRIIEMLGLDDQAQDESRSLRNRWCLEPTVLGRKGGVIHRQEDFRELTELVRSEG